jgi:chemotaxis protein MotB
VSVFQAPPSRPAAIDLGGGLQGVGTQDNPASEAQPATRAFEQAIQDDFPVPSVAASQADVSAGDIEQALVEPIELEQVRVRQSEHWLEVELDAEFAFASGAAHLAAGALPALEKIAELLTRSRTPIRVEGFTDDVAVNGGPFASNWALSAARAGSVAAALQNFGVDAQRLAATGFGSLQPRADNASEAGRRSNRRVVIALAKRPDVAAASVSAPAAEGPEYVPLEQLERVNVLPGAAEIEL